MLSKLSQRKKIQYDLNYKESQKKKIIISDRVDIIEWHTDSMDMSLSKLWDLGIHREDWCATVHGVTKSRTRLND